MTIRGFDSLILLMIVVIAVYTLPLVFAEANEMIVVYQSLIAAACTISIAYMQYRTKTAVDKSTKEATLNAQAVMTTVAAVGEDATKNAEWLSRQAQQVKQNLDTANQEKIRNLGEVKTTLEESTKVNEAKLEHLANIALDTKKTTEAVHVLVNSAMNAQLKVSMIALKRVADLTGDEDDSLAAKLAKTAYEEHIAKQVVVDAGGKIPVAAEQGGE